MLPDTSVVVLVVMWVLAAAVLVGVGWWALSRYAGGPAGGTAPIPCAHRAGPGHPWALGTLCYDGPALLHRSGTGRGAGRTCRWERVGLDLWYARRAAGEPGLPAELTLVVTGRYGDTELELALTDQHYLALRSWVEAAPPGYNVNVA